MLPQRLWQRFRAHRKVFLQLLLVLLLQPYLGVHRQAMVEQPLLLTAFTGLAVQLQLQQLLLELRVLLIALHTRLRFTQPILRVRVQVQHLIASQPQPLLGHNFIQLRVLIVLLYLRELLNFRLWLLVVALAANLFMEAEVVEVLDIQTTIAYHRGTTLQLLLGRAE
jgi:hypothetical protein